MFEEAGRKAIYVYLYYNRDYRKLYKFGDLAYHSRRFRYVQLFVESKNMGLIQQLQKESFVKEIKPCYIGELPESFQGLSLEVE